MCNSENYSCAITIIISLLLGALVALLFNLGVITNSQILLISILVIAVLIIIFSFVVIIIPRYNDCVLKYMCSIMVGFIGSVLLSILALSISLEINVYTTILIGALVFFLSLMVIRFINLINCIIDYNNNNNCPYANLPNNFRNN